MLTGLIYRIKRQIHRWPALYQCLFGVATLNRDYGRQWLQRGAFPSKFGGMWTDHNKFEHQLARKLANGDLDPAIKPLLEQWRTKGFVTFPGAITADLIDSYLEEIEALKKEMPSPLLVTAASLPQPRHYQAKLEQEEHSVRTVDDYFFSAASRAILLEPQIMAFLTTVFEAKPLLNQSLSFKHGSQQEVHQDTAFVRMNAPMKLAAIWVALEDVQPGSGELVYYPGSHRWEGFLFSDRFKHWDEERDGIEQLDTWHRWIHEEAARRQCELQTFLPKKGDVFVWHAGLAHGGAPVIDHTATRKSLVGHYCPEGVRPLYHYYKPGQRKCYRHGPFSYCTSYYR